jgi:hypothetical protein
MQAIKTCTDAIIDNLALIQRDDGRCSTDGEDAHALARTCWR